MEFIKLTDSKEKPWPNSELSTSKEFGDINDFERLFSKAII
jgi:hypothetical protein